MKLKSNLILAHWQILNIDSNPNSIMLIKWLQSYSVCSKVPILNNNTSHHWQDAGFVHGTSIVKLAEFILGTNYPSETNYMSDRGNSSA